MVDRRTADQVYSDRKSELRSKGWSSNDAYRQMKREGII